MSDEPAFDPAQFWYTELRPNSGKVPAHSWGGYDQPYGDAAHVHAHDEVTDQTASNWGIVGTIDPPHATHTLLVFDIDIHKAPAEFDPDRVDVSGDTLVVRSQNGGLHVYFRLVGTDRGSLTEAAFQMTADPGFDVDIRGSAVSHHIVAPTLIPGVENEYTVKSNETITTVASPAAAARRLTLDGDPLLEYSPDDTDPMGQSVQPSDAPTEHPACYQAGLQLRTAPPETRPDAHRVNALTAMCGLAAGYAPEEVVDHFCTEYPLGGDESAPSDWEMTNKQVSQIAANEYNPPTEATLREHGILDADAHCDDSCPVPYHGRHPTSTTADTEGTAMTGDGSRPANDRSPASEGATDESADTLRAAIRDATVGAVGSSGQSNRRVRNKIAEAFDTHRDFVYPEAEVKGWRTTLYVYDPKTGVYEPRGETVVGAELEAAAGDFATNRTITEVVGKLQRRNTAREEAFTMAPERLAVANGILDLHTGEIEPFTPDEYHRQKLPIRWNPEAGDPEAIDAFFHDIVVDEDVQTLYRLAAHTLYKEYIGEKAAILIGSGQNGKSVFIDLIEQFLGVSNVTHQELQDFDENGFAASNLEGKLANLATEIGEQKLTDTTTFKKLTGRDTLDARVKYEKPITFENYATLMFATNEMPVFEQDNHAIWRRWVYLEFPYTFSAADPGAKDPTDRRTLMDRLTQQTELEALLARCQQEIERWHHDEDAAFFADAMPADAVRNKMKQAAEPVYAFASTCLSATTDDTAYIEKAEVRKLYRAYAAEQDLSTLPQNTFGERLLSLRDFQIESGQKRIDGKPTHVYEGIELSSYGRQLLGGDSTADGQHQLDDTPQAMAVVEEQLQKMVKENDGEPVPKSGVVWRCSGQIGKTTAENALAKLLRTGRALDAEMGVQPIDR
jgi:P4 family phage/plasmid primase-like protien